MVERAGAYPLRQSPAMRRRVKSGRYSVGVIAIWAYDDTFCSQVEGRTVLLTPRYGPHAPQYYRRAKLSLPHRRQNIFNLFSL